MQGLRHAPASTRAVGHHDEAQREADALTLPDLKFQALGVRSLELVDRGLSAENNAVLEQIKARVRFKSYR